MKRYVLLLSLSLGSLVQMYAQSLEEFRSEWNESSANVSDNIRYTSLNPSRISFNSYKNKGVAKLDYTIGRGSYRPVDEGRLSNHLKFYMGGLKNLGKTRSGTPPFFSTPITHLCFAIQWQATLPRNLLKWA